MESARLWQQCHSEGSRRCSIDVAAIRLSDHYILTAFFQTTFPTGQYKNGSTKTIITPTIAYGKGFGRFDIQGTFGATLPTGNEAKIGRSFPWNNTFQYHVSKKIWPEIETNYTHFQDGAQPWKDTSLHDSGNSVWQFPSEEEAIAKFWGRIPSGHDAFPCE